MRSEQVWVWVCAVLSACAPAGPRSDAARDAPGAVLGSASTPTALDGLGWDERIGLERALAERDPRHAPTSQDGRPELASRGVTASFGEAAELRIGEHRATLRAVSIGRGDARTELATPTPTVEGPEVRAERAPGIVEWWRSLASGLEHGVTIAERPAGDGELTLDVEVTGLGVRSAGDDAVELTDASGAVVATYAHLVVTDGRDRTLPATLRARSGGIEIGVADGDAAYPIVIDPLVAASEAVLTGYHIGGDVGDRFGASVALSADAAYALVGAPYEDVRGTDSGVAFVFTRSGTTWSTTPSPLIASDTTSSDLLGGAVALSADGTRAFVGAPFQDTAAGANAGSVRVFVRSGTTWTLEATLLATSAAANDNLGQSLSASSDGSRVIAGASAGLAGVGSARVFVRTGTSWSEEGRLLAPGGLAGELFGTSVALSADGSRALVGAPNDSVGPASFCGSVVAFVRTGSSWTVETTLLAPDRAISDAFGTSVALSADGALALIGVPGDDNDGISRPGSVRVFERTGTTWAQTSALVPIDRGANDEVGRAVALTPDATHAVIGAPGDSTTAYGAGSARVFVRTGPSWVEAVTLTATGGGASSMAFGSSVAVAADGTRAMVGAPLWDTVTTDAGTAHVLTLRGTLGTPCAVAGACMSGLCVDGVCCNEACGDGANDCRACSVAAGGGADGTCGPLSVVAAARAVCRPSASLCDQEETCSPSSTTCPTDRPQPSGYVCRPAGTRLCDVAETCDGSSFACPGDLVAAAGTVCRTAAGACDTVDQCDGVSAECADTRVAAGTICRLSLGACDPTEACDGTSSACPADSLSPMGTVCGVAMGDCATPGTCNGTSAMCSSTGARPVGTLCRAAVSACDVDDFCDGTSQVCPNVFAPDTRSCGGLPSGACDAQDHCTGTSGDCVPEFLADVECRPSTGACDPEELCTGDRADCPPDQFSPSGTVCRASTDGCDPAESCDGVAASCPADENACMPSDGGALDAGRSDGGGTDAGGTDAGNVPVPTDGCACRVAPRAEAGSLGALVLSVAWALVIVRRRRRRAW